MNNPKVSVIIPVFNCEKYIREAIESILNQTFTDYELIIINDGSTDNSVKIIKSILDKRIKFIDNKVNLGQTAARNIGIKVSSGKYIAWLDADDISSPERLKKQVNILDRYSKIGICGTWVKVIDDVKKNEEEIIWKFSSDLNKIKANMAFMNPVATSSVMLKKKILIDNNLAFNENVKIAEDYDLWERMSYFCDIVNIPEVLVYYRLHNNQTSVNKYVDTELESDKIKIQNEFIWNTQLRQINLLDIEPSNEEKRIHLSIFVDNNLSNSYNFFYKANNWLKRLKKTNLKLKIFPKKEFNNSITKKWILIYNNIDNKNILIKIYALLRTSCINFWSKIYFFSKVIYMKNFFKKEKK